MEKIEKPPPAQSKIKDESSVKVENAKKIDDSNNKTTLTSDTQLGGMDLNDKG